jgi:hypothetical protein
MLEGQGLSKDGGWNRSLYSPHCPPGRKLAQMAPQGFLLYNILWYRL